MPDINAIIDQCVKTHYGHVTPGTPDHFVLSRFTADLKNQLNPQPAEPESAPTLEQPEGE